MNAQYGILCSLGVPESKLGGHTPAWRAMTTPMSMPYASYDLMIATTAGLRNGQLSSLLAAPLGDPYPSSAKLMLLVVCFGV